MNLFQLGSFRLHSGKESSFKIDCDALSNSDLHTIVHLLLPLLPKFTEVVGIPRGGIRLANLLKQHCIAPNAYVRAYRLIVDDVYTTGMSMEEAVNNSPHACWGAVIFARKKVPAWITPLFTLNTR